MRTALLLALALTSTAALAQSPASTTNTTTTAPEPEVRYRSNTVIDIGPIDVIGAVQGPPTYRLHQRKKVGFRPLIELRADFRAELSTSTAGL